MLYHWKKNTVGSSFLDWFHCILALFELWKMNAELWLANAVECLWSVGIFIEVQCCQMKSINKCHSNYDLQPKDRINKLLVAGLYAYRQRHSLKL